MKQPDRFELIRAMFSKVEQITESGCWIYHGRISHDGYAVAWLDKKHVRVHRVFYELRNGKIPPGLECDHLCRVRNCVNPDHIQPVPGYINGVVRGEGIAANNAKKNTCKNGHVFDRIRPWGVQGKLVRNCSICEAAGLRIRRARKKAAYATA